MTNIHETKLRILFISRAYPPVKGGIEKQNYETFLALSRHCEINLVKNSYGKAFIPFFIPYALLFALFSRKYDAILLGDGVLAIIGYITKIFRGKKVISFIHGLDITFSSRCYQSLWVGKFIPAMDALIVPSVATQKHALDRNIPMEKLMLIPDGVNIPPKSAPSLRSDFEKVCKHSLPGITILTLGRLVKRKGVEWFVESVLPLLTGEWTYIIAGDGKEKENIEKAIVNSGLSERIIFLGEVSEEEKAILYQNADIFIQPNISIPGDIEGFGLVVLEAASHGVPVIASSIDGLQDAISDGKNGLLIAEKDKDRFASAIQSFQTDAKFRKQFGQGARQFCIENLTWEHMAIRIADLFRELCHKGSNIHRLS